MPDTADPPDLADPSAPARPAGVMAASSRAALALRLVVAELAIALAAILVLHYPLAPHLLAALLLLYGAALWRWPLLWLAVVPAVLPAFDLTPWTGALPETEPDLFVLVTLATLVLRAPPARADFRLRGLAGAAVLLVILATIVGVVRGLALPGLAEGSAIAILQPDNALRVAKGFATALVLLPFLRQAVRTRADALDWLAAGMTAGLALVAMAAVAERLVFVGLSDFTSGYRIVATFSSMHLGGGYVGAYIAMALPFPFVLMPRARPWLLALAALVAAGALYALIITFARAAYGSATLACIVLVAGWAVAGRHARVAVAALALPLALLLVVLGLVGFAAIDSRFMALRLERVLPDLASREAEWSEGLSLAQGGIGTALLGMGLGTFPRVAFERRPEPMHPSNFTLQDENGVPYLAVEAGLPLYIGQKIALAPRQWYRLELALRSPDGRGKLVVLLCEKLLLYSINCRGAQFRPSRAGVWEEVGGEISSAGIGERRTLGFLRRPVELSLLVSIPGTELDIADVRLTDFTGRPVLANGDFSGGLERWYESDDIHSVWRIENQYLTDVFAGGALGLAAFLLLAGAALGGAGRAIAGGNPIAPALAAAIAAVLASSLFDCPLEVPRLAALFYLVAFAAICAGEEHGLRAGDELPFTRRSSA
jgi:hypothetical protein